MMLLGGVFRPLQVLLSLAALSLTLQQAQAGWSNGWDKYCVSRKCACKYDAVSYEDMLKIYPIYDTVDKQFVSAGNTWDSLKYIATLSGRQLYSQQMSDYRRLRGEAGMPETAETLTIFEGVTKAAGAPEGTSSWSLSLHTLSPPPPFLPPSVKVTYDAEVKKRNDVYLACINAQGCLKNVPLSDCPYKDYFQALVEKNN